MVKHPFGSPLVDQSAAAAVETPLPPVSPGEVEIPAVETPPIFDPGLPAPGDGVSALMGGRTLPDLFSYAPLAPEFIGIAVGAFLAFLCVRQLWRRAPALGGSRSISLINPENRARGMESLPPLLGRVLPETLAAGAAVLAAGHGLLAPAFTSWAPWQWALIGGTALRLALYAAALTHGAGHALASKIVSPGGAAGHFTLLMREYRRSLPLSSLLPLHPIFIPGLAPESGAPLMRNVTPAGWRTRLAALAGLLTSSLGALLPSWAVPHLWTSPLDPLTAFAAFFQGANIVALLSSFWGSESDGWVFLRGRGAAFFCGNSGAVGSRDG